MIRVIIFSILFLSACSEQDVMKCLTEFAGDLGTLTAQEITSYEEEGCCLYNGGVAPTINCDGWIVCKDKTVSNCRK